MLEVAEKEGLLKQGGTVVEPTSGNTGAGLALAAAVRGYRCICVMPDKVSQEKRDLLKAMGAEVVVTPTTPPEDPEGYYAVAERLADEIPGGFKPGQYENPANPLAHYETTGPELWRDLDENIDAFVYGSGTGGTITGVGRFLKERNPEVRIVAVEPARSPVISGGERGQHQFQGMGPGFIPANLDLTVVDEVLPQWEEEAFPLARRLAREEGLFLGMSSGAIVLAALKVARALGPGHRVAAISPDSGARYLSTTLYAEPRGLGTFTE
jgi:cysteine synthase A